MLSDEFAWAGGEIVLWDLDFLDPTVPLADQLDSLKEDLAQVRYSERVTLDVGWYPEFSENGAFRVLVILDSNWDAPRFSERYETVGTLVQGIHRGMHVAASLVRSS